jgi:hypothetical protein
MTKDFIDEQITVVEIKKTVKKSSKERFQASKPNSFEIIGIEVKHKRIISEETRKKISEAHKGRKHPPVTEEARKKMSDFQRNRIRGPQSEETKRKISEAHKGKVKPSASEETRRKMSESRRGKKKAPRTEEHTRNSVAGRVANRPSVMTPHGEFVSRKALIRKITDDGILNATYKLIEWFKLYPTYYYYIKKPKKIRRIQGVT